VIKEVVDIAFFNIWWGCVLEFLGLFGTFWTFEGLVDDGIGL
jgi:hypothetical protein